MHKNRCAHARCSCEAPIGKKYCSDACEKQGATAGGCRCGHAGCTTKK